jgi:drug/metabolite transporter (DMT)-like permease
MAVMMAWGLNIPAVKALTGVMDVVWVGAIRLLAASVAITACVWVRDRRLPRIGGRNWALLAGVAFLTIYLNQLLFVRGMRMTAATSASLVMALMPLLAVVAGALAYRERISARAACGLALGFGGVALVVLMAPGAKVGMPGAGELVILAGLVVFISGGLIIQRAVRQLDALVVGWVIYVTGSAMLLLHAIAAGGWQRTVTAFDAHWVWWCALYSGVIGTALSNVGWYHAIGRVGQGRASPYLYWIAVFGVLFSALMLSEPLAWWHVAGLALVVAGVRMGGTPQRLA